MKPPETTLIAIQCADGSVAVMAFVLVEYDNAGGARWTRAATDDTVSAEVARAALSFDSDKLPIAGWQHIDRADLPTDRYFRDAWTHDGKRVDVDMSKAREIHRNILREARAPKLAALDVAYMRALEQGDTQAAADVAAEKQLLRDVTADPRIDAAASPEELKAVTPEALGG